MVDYSHYHGRSETSSQALFHEQVDIVLGSVKRSGARETYNDGRSQDDTGASGHFRDAGAKAGAW